MIKNNYDSHFDKNLWQTFLTRGEIEFDAKTKFQGIGD